LNYRDDINNMVATGQLGDYAPIPTVNLDLSGHHIAEDKMTTLYYGGGGLIAAGLNP